MANSKRFESDQFDFMTLPELYSMEILLTHTISISGHMAHWDTRTFHGGPQEFVTCEPQCFVGRKPLCKTLC